MAGERVYRELYRQPVDTVSEVERIREGIISDYRTRRISYRKAMARMNFLGALLHQGEFVKNFRERGSSIVDAREAVERGRDELKQMRR